MPSSTRTIMPCLWFDHRVEEAVNFYISVFGGRIIDMLRFPEGGPQPKGSVLSITFTIQDEEVIALNVGQHMKFNEAASLFVKCRSQAEVDKYWNALIADGGEEGQCGWLRDKYGLSWQIVPTALGQLIIDKDAAKAQYAVQAMMKMKKIEIAALQRPQAA